MKKKAIANLEKCISLCRISHSEDQKDAVKELIDGIAKAYAQGVPPAEVTRVLKEYSEMPGLSTAHTGGAPYKPRQYRPY